MASYRNLRLRTRPASAGVGRAFPWSLAALLLLLAVAVGAAVVLVAGRTSPAHVKVGPAYLARALGAPTHDGPVARPRPISVTLGVTHAGPRLGTPLGDLTLSAQGIGNGRWAPFTNGYARTTRVGQEVVTLGSTTLEQSLVVDRRVGTRIWSWKLDGLDNLDPRLRVDGSVEYRSKGTNIVRILPVEILDRRGKNVTPAGARWSLARSGGSWRLELRLNDHTLPAPYVIDPIAIVGACGPGTGTFAGCTVVASTGGAASLVITRPTGVANGNVLVAQVTTRNNAAITAPAGWTQIGTTLTSGATLEQAVYYKVANAEPANYTWTWAGTVDRAGAIIAYSGVSTVASDIVDASSQNGSGGGTGTTATATGVTTLMNGDQMIALYGEGRNTALTQSGGEGMTQQYTATSTNGTAANRVTVTGADGNQATAGATGNKTATMGIARTWVANLVTLVPTLSANGSGTMTVAPSNVSASATGRTLTFTYTAATGGMRNGVVRVTVPAGWTAPNTTSGTAGYTVASTGAVGVAGQIITVTGVTLQSAGTMTITYGSGVGGGVTVTSTTGTSTFTAAQAATSAGVVTNIAASPTVAVRAPDGSGTMTVNKTNVSAGATSQTLTFTYTAATGGINTGALRLLAPANWTAPAGGNTSIAFSGSGTGTLGFSGQQINVTALNMTAGETMTVTYGAVTVPAVGTGATWTTSENSSPNPGTLVAIATSPTVNVRAADGSGTMTVNKTDVSAGATSQTLTFTYTAASGGIGGGALRLLAPANWTAPAGGNTSIAFSGSGTGTLGFSGQQINVTALNMTAGETMTVTYGAVTVPAVGTGATWTTSENSSPNPGTLVAIATSPTVNVRAADGSGTMTVNKTDVSAGATSQTLTFTYTASSGGLGSGALRLLAPANWTAPAGGNTSIAFSGSGTGTLGFSGQQINVTSLNMTAGETMTVTYGAVTVPAVGTGATWTTSENSSPNPGTLVAIATSPTVNVRAADGSGTMTVNKTDVSAGATSPDADLHLHRARPAESAAARCGCSRPRTGPHRRAGTPRSPSPAPARGRSASRGSRSTSPRST